MNVVFYLSSAIAILATLMVVTRSNVVHALLYLILSLLSVALIFFVLGAPFVAALEVIIYAGAIMVLFLFGIMMLGLGPRSSRQERAWLHPGSWAVPSIFAAVLLAELVYVLVIGRTRVSGAVVVDPHQVSLTLFGPYILGVELASTLLLAGVVAAYHLGRRIETPRSTERGPL
jgi:NADH-quinone oxidoreductase subunit J